MSFDFLDELNKITGNKQAPPVAKGYHALLESVKACEKFFAGTFDNEVQPASRLKRLREIEKQCRDALKEASK